MRHEKFSGYYRMQDSLCICSHVNGLLGGLRFPHSPEKWGLTTKEEGCFVT
jgi:hypothetical protein